MPRADCVIVGAGLAGAATAYHLSRRGMRRIVLVEREPHAGFHASSRNAAMVRQLVPDPNLLRLCLDGAAFLHRAEREWSQGPVFQPGGSIFTASGAAWRTLLASLDRARAAGLEAEVWEPEHVGRAVPAARGARFEGAVHTPSDGTADVHALLHGFLAEARAAGADVCLRAPLRTISVDDGLRITGVKAGDVEISTAHVVNAAGAWCESVAALAGATPIAFAPYRRHLVYTGPHPLARRGAPYVWDLDRDLYFRPESEGWLLSPCDESWAEPGVPETDPAALELLERKLRDGFPALADLPVARSWAGLRTFAPDRQFVLGPDPRVTGLHWAAGLGGHGVTTSSAVGSLVAAGVLGDGAVPTAFRPERFAGTTTRAPAPS